MSTQKKPNKLLTNKEQEVLEIVQTFMRENGGRLPSVKQLAVRLPDSRPKDNFAPVKSPLFTKCMVAEKYMLRLIGKGYIAPEGSGTAAMRTVLEECLTFMREVPIAMTHSVRRSLLIQEIEEVLFRVAAERPVDPEMNGVGS